MGAGVIGLATAYELGRRRHAITLIDRGAPGQECSRSNAGWICPSFAGPLPAPGLGLRSLTWMLRRNSPLHISPRAVPSLAPWLLSFWRHCNVRDYSRGLEALVGLNASTMQLFDAWAADGVAFEMRRLGILWAFLDARRAREATADFRALDRLGYATPDLLGGAELRRLEPGLSDRVASGFLVEQERYARPETLVDGLSVRARQLGVQISTGVEVQRGIARGRTLLTLTTSEGEVSADAFVIAAGAWSGQLASNLGASVPVQAGKGYSITLPAPQAVFSRSVYFSEAKVAVTPFEGAVRIAGTMELSGLNTYLDRRRLAALQRSTDRYCQTRPSWHDGDSWVGARPITPDGLPVIGRLTGFDNVWVATGHGMLGVTLAPATAQLLADMIDGRTNGHDAGAFDMARFRRR